VRYQRGIYGNRYDVSSFTPRSPLLPFVLPCRPSSDRGLSVVSHVSIVKMLGHFAPDGSLVGGSVKDGVLGAGVRFTGWLRKPTLVRGRSLDGKVTVLFRNGGHLRKELRLTHGGGDDETNTADPRHHMPPLGPD